MLFLPCRNSPANCFLGEVHVLAAMKNVWERWAGLGLGLALIGLIAGFLGINAKDFIYAKLKPSPVAEAHRTTF